MHSIPRFLRATVLATMIPSKVAFTVRNQRRLRPSIALLSSSRLLSDGLEDPSGPLPNDRPYSEKFIDQSFNAERITYQPIAVALTPFRERHGTPRQPCTEGSRGQTTGTLRLLPDVLGGTAKARAMLEDLDSFSHVIVLAHLHLNTGWNERVTPPRLRHMKGNGKKGLLATRAPHRPNNIGMSVLKLASVNAERLELLVESIDLINGTPIIDIKPYIKQYDSIPTAKCGWVDTIQLLENAGELPRITHDGGASAGEESKNRKTYTIEGTGKGSSALLRTDTGHELATDLPKNMGGDDSAAQPVEHLLAAFIGCSQATAIFVGRMMKPRLLVDRIEFNIEARRDQRGALQLPIHEVPDIQARLEHVSGNATAFFKEDQNVTQNEIDLLREQTEARCPVANMMVASGCTMNIKWVAGEKD